MEYRTSDIVLAATLRYSKFRLIKAERIDPNSSHVNFVFDIDDEKYFDEFLNHYFLGELLTEPVLFYNMTRQLSVVARNTK